MAAPHPCPHTASPSWTWRVEHLCFSAADPLQGRAAQGSGVQSSLASAIGQPGGISWDSPSAGWCLSNAGFGCSHSCYNSEVGAGSRAAGTCLAGWPKGAVLAPPASGSSSHSPSSTLSCCQPDARWQTHRERPGERTPVLGDRPGKVAVPSAPRSPEFQSPLPSTGRRHGAPGPSSRSPQPRGG